MTLVGGNSPERLLVDKEEQNDFYTMGTLSLIIILYTLTIVHHCTHMQLGVDAVCNLEGCRKIESDQQLTKLSQNIMTFTWQP